MKRDPTTWLDTGGKRAGNAHDRRRSPTKRERSRLARRWNRRAQAWRRHRLRFEAYNTWGGCLTGWPNVEEVIFAIDGVGEERHPIEGARNAWSLANALRVLGYGMLAAVADIISMGDSGVIVRARSFGFGLTFTDTPGLMWTEIASVTSGAANRMPEPFKVTGRAS
jgi:hypothetical protein